MSYKFKIDGKIPSDDKIDKHKDFKKLRANYDKQVAPLYKKPLYKDPKALIVVLIILLLTYLIVEAYQKDGNEEHKMEQQDNKMEQQSKSDKPKVLLPMLASDSIKKDSLKNPKQIDSIHVSKKETKAPKK